MSAAVSSALPTPYVPPLPAVDANAALQTTASPQPATPSAPALTSGGGISGNTLGVLVTQQEVPAGAAVALDLKGQDLRTTDLKRLDLRGADLSGSDLSGVDLTGLDLSGAKLASANLSGANLTNTNLTNVSAQGADFSQAKLQNTGLDGGDFSNAKFNGAFVGRSDAGQDQYGSPAFDIANNVKLDGASLAGATLQRVAFRQGSAAGADFSNATTNRVGFTGLDLAGANFDGLAGSSVYFSDGDMSGAGLTNMTVASKGFGSMTLDGAKFSGTSFDHTSFNGDNLTTADLSGVVRTAQFASFVDTNLAGIDFSGFDLFGAALFAQQHIGPGPSHEVKGAGTSFQGANFTGANLAYADFQDTNPTGADFSGATFKRTMIHGQARTMLAATPGVIDGMGNGWTPAETQGIQDMRWGRRPVTATFEFHDTPRKRSDQPGDYDYFIVPPDDLNTPDWKRPEVAKASLSERDKAAALALTTLTAINDQLSAAKSAGDNKDPAPATDAASVALSVLTKAADAREAAADKKADDAKVAADDQRTEGPLALFRRAAAGEPATAPKTLAVA